MPPWRARRSRPTVPPTRRGATVVVITHRTSVLGVAHKMLLIRDGVQQAFGPRDEVLAALQQAAVAPRQAA